MWLEEGEGDGKSQREGEGDGKRERVGERRRG